MDKFLMDDLFPAPVFTKPREVRQTWLKDPGFKLAGWGEKMGLIELPDFLEVMAPRLDYVKIFPDDVIDSPRDWFVRKIATYLDYSVTPYLDHQYFRMIWEKGKIEEGIAAGAEFGIKAMEFTNVDSAITAQQWAGYVKFAASQGVAVVFEFYPARLTRGLDHEGPTDGETILETAMPCMDAGAFALMVDHEEFDLQGDAAADELGKLVAKLGLAKLIFEVDSRTCYKHLKSFFGYFGPDANVSNIMPGQVTIVEQARKWATPK